MLRALTVGINDYSAQDANLAGCVNDANDWAAFLAGRGYATTTLLDKDATRVNVLAALDGHVRSLAPGDGFVFTFSGHGSWVVDRNNDEPDGRDEVLCPHDLAADRLIVDDELAEIFARAVTGSVVVFVSDCCHSGTVARFGGTPRAYRKIRYLPPTAFLGDDPTLATRLSAMARAPAPQLQGTTPGLVHLAGCQDREYSYDAEFGGRPNGAFTRACLDAMAADPPPASYALLYKAVRKRLPSWDYPQTPRLNAAPALAGRKAFA